MPDAVDAWCLRHLGSVPAQTLFTGGNLAAVHGVRLADGRDVVVKVRPSAARYAGCTAVQRHLWAAGFPCPEPLAGPLPLMPEGEGGAGVAGSGALCVNAESLVPGGGPYPAGGDEAAETARSAAFAGLLARFVALAPSPAEVGDLAPSPAWIDWDHAHPGLWPPPDDRDVDLNALPETAWIDELGREARARLAAARDAARVIGHCDWESHNLDFRDGRPVAVHDWDSVAAAPETVIVGVAGAMWPAGAHCAGASLEQTEAFLDAYQSARGRRFSPGELAQCWAAGLWIRAFNAKKFLLDGLETLTPAEGAQRLRRAGGSGL